MANHSLKQLAPLGFEQPQIDEIGKVCISENINFALASIAQREGQEKPFAAATKIVLKLVMPRTGKSVKAGDFTVIWSGPDQWLVEAPEASHEELATLLKKNYKESASITEQSGGWCKFDVDGENSVPLLQRICSADTQTMEAGMATRSVIEHIGVLVLCHEAGMKFSIYGPRSSAGSLHHALTTAAMSVA